MGRLNGWKILLGVGLVAGVAAAVTRPMARVAVAREAGAVAADDGDFKPVPLPDLGIPGFVFPEKESTILGWIQANY